jgi:dienelactone hydrolase
MDFSHIAELRLDQFRDRFGWIIGMAILVVALGVLLAEWRAPRSGRGFAVGASALIGVVFGGILLVPALPRLAVAVELATGRQPPPPSGPLPVATLDLTLAPLKRGDPPIVAALWFPATRASPARPGPSSCAQGLGGLRLAGGNARLPILLYVPGLGGGRRQGALNATDLASHGYAVLAVDDIQNDPVPPGTDAETVAVRRLDLDFSSAAAFEATLRRAGEKAVMQAEKALAALDRLQACVAALPAPGWRGRLDFAHVGFFGYSFGGSTAAEAGALDPRVAAVVNMDGWLFGTAAMGGLDKPYFLMLSDYPLPGPDKLESADPGIRYLWSLTDRDLRYQHELTARPDGYGVSLRNAYHESYSDQIFDRRFFKSWLTLDPVRSETIINAYLRAFFDTYLKGKAQPLLRRDPPPYPEVEFFNTSAHWRMGTATAPTQSAAGSK